MNTTRPLVRTAIRAADQGRSNFKTEPNTHHQTKNDAHAEHARITRAAQDKRNTK